MGGAGAPVFAGLAVGVAVMALFATLPIPEYPIYSNYSYPSRKAADYTPLLQLGISGLRDTYKVGEGIDFSVRQTAGGSCTFPELITIRDLDRGTIVKEWNGTEASAMLHCPVEFNPATSSTTWSTVGHEEKPIIINQTGSYAVTAKHLFKTVQKEFRLIAVSDTENDTSPEVAARLSSASKEMETVKALLEKYPNANLTVTANYYSRLFQEFQKYHPSAIVQYSVAKTDSYPLTEAGPNKAGRALLLTIIFDRYYENNTPQLNIVQCIGENDSSLSVSVLPIGISEIKC